MGKLPILGAGGTPGRRPAELASRIVAERETRDLVGPHSAGSWLPLARLVPLLHTREGTQHLAVAVVDTRVGEDRPVAVDTQAGEGSPAAVVDTLVLVPVGEDTLLLAVEGMPGVPASWAVAPLGHHSPHEGILLPSLPQALLRDKTCPRGSKT